MRYYIWTAGCQMNVADSQRLAASLEALGYEPCDRAEQADVIVLNTCVVRQSAEDRAHGRLSSLRPLKQKRPDLVINLMGCMVGVKGSDRLRQVYPHVDVFSPPSDPEPLLRYLLAKTGKRQWLDETRGRFAIMDEELRLPQHERGKLVSAYIPIVYGCSHACTFCVIPYRRGPERSRPMAQILAEARSLVSQGVREITLLGQIVDRYGLDLGDGTSLPALLQALHEIDGLERIRFLTSHPNWMNDELLEAFAELPKVCEHIEVPVQAGDDEILRRMKRGYTAEDYRRLIARIRALIPGAAIATDIIVGFPGETEEQFRRTFDLLTELRFDVAHLARYSPRPQTVSARRMQDSVPEEEKMRRFRLLEELQAGIAAEINAGYLDQIAEVLVESQENGRWRGRTRTNKLVFFEDEGEWLGRLAPVRITWTGPWSMIGEVALKGTGLAQEAQAEEIWAHPQLP
ncbi:MAG TPA: tRNA (N6-isopentenyl adenosine(37)-C2)-methylthiotransferase MiaB [Chloroflexi bacterium]|nr:tRNA (N6-isopentenyl adenosine(37)-C2)-methylthiotransferase MiaB [Chloroflexota bacterium]